MESECQDTLREAFGYIFIYCGLCLRNKRQKIKLLEAVHVGTIETLAKVFIYESESKKQNKANTCSYHFYLK